MLKCWERTVRAELSRAQGNVVTLLDDLSAGDALDEFEARLRTLDGPVTLAGWSVPERNLHYPAFWLAWTGMRVRGARAFSRFKAFLGRFGVEGVAYRSGRPVLKRRVLCGGAATLVVLGSLEDDGGRSLSALARNGKAR